eukprot:TRINITY_DN3202_c0_g1_i1.p1 TRINITY_DN3202_c0_g1~~TRINITY_DN3202_c0_g1_i1.p1  ORF type:complete len:792 (+),score=130.33 TRINITY_DN3202_c0_g1_i1:68-2443(+)
MATLSGKILAQPWTVIFLLQLCIGASKSSAFTSCGRRGTATCKTNGTNGLELLQRKSRMNSKISIRADEASGEVLSCKSMTEWPDVDNGITCTNCQALVLTGPHGGRCDAYCESFGHVCVAAAEEVNENCEVKEDKRCDEAITGTSDMLCTCSLPSPSSTTTTTTTTSTPAEPTFLPVDGGFGRACRGDDGLDNSASYYRLSNQKTLLECKAQCLISADCKGIEYSSSSGRCEVWTREIGASIKPSLSGFQCLRFISGPSSVPVMTSELVPVDGGVGRACRGQDEFDNSPSYFNVYFGKKSLAECEALCLFTEGCKGIEYSQNLGRCEVWTATIGSSAAVAGFACYKIPDMVRDLCKSSVSFDDVWECPQDEIGEELLLSANLANSDDWFLYRKDESLANASFNVPGSLVHLSNNGDNLAWHVQLLQQLSIDRKGGSSYEFCIEAGAEEGGGIVQFRVDGDQDKNFAVVSGLEPSRMELRKSGLRRQCFRFSLDHSFADYTGRVAIELGDSVGKIAVCQASLRRCGGATGPIPPAPTPGRVTRFMSWNVYYANLAAEWRVDGIAQGIVDVNPEIASIQEMWSEKPAILKKVIEKTQKEWRFAEGGETEKVWDGDILYRSDLWNLRDSGMLAYGDRGISWALLQRISDGFNVLVYGTHPWCCTNDRPILETVVKAVKLIEEHQQKWPYPSVFMGDMNANYYSDSQKLLREGSVFSHNEQWSISKTFLDAYAIANPSNPNPSTIGNSPVKIDYVYFEQSPRRLGKSRGGKVWSGLPGGSDHRAVTGDVELTVT